MLTTVNLFNFNFLLSYKLIYEIFKQINNVRHVYCYHQHIYMPCVNTVLSHIDVIIFYCTCD